MQLRRADLIPARAGMTTAASPTTPAISQLSHRQVLTAFSGILLAMLLSSLDSTIVATALPTIVGELGGLERLAWVVTAYLLAQTVVTPLYGKLGDLYGRKRVLQSAIVLFLVGSVLCGLSRSMAQLIVFRFVQGLGGGGLLVTTQAAVGDIVPPRERGRYQGIFGAVFGVSSIAGPLLGGYFTTHLSWRWIFYVNVPLGLIAMVVIGATLPRRAERVRHVVDYLGAGLLATSLAAIVLLTDLGGTTYAWGSPVILALIALAVLALVGFVAAERRAPEPVVPLQLFANRTFTLTSIIGFVVGFALFGSVTYIPLFLQVVNGASPTGSGLQMLPMMGGMLVTSIATGQLISRRGRYKKFPIAGTLVMAVGLFLLSRMTAETGIGQASVNMLVLGLGLGMVMQVLVIAVQNAVDYRDLGVATSGATLFRLVGGAIGTAVFGAVFAARLTSYLARTLPPGAEGARPGTGISPQMLAQLPPALREIYVTGFTAALSTVFITAMVVALLGFVLTWFVPERPLRESITATAGDVGAETGEIFPMPTDASSVSALERALSLMASRDVKREYIAHVVARSGVELTPGAAWLLVRLEQDPTRSVAALAERYRLPPERLAAAAAELEEKGMVTEHRSADGAPRWELGDAGCAALGRLVEARRAHLSEVLAEWAPERREELAEVMRRFSHALVPGAPSRAA
ncbi:MAG TPA: MFS transporter [Gemmatimonadaceae bacterium]|nr:MFS transporter [Gemmatimonadaceae bacterium]